MALKLFLNSKTILEYTFPLAKANAYNAEEVDRFLDMVIEDYKVAEANAIISLDEYNSIKEKVKTLEKDKRQIEVELEKYKARFINIKTSDNVTTDNIELVKRINALEKFLWSNGFNPNTIK
ncbi:MAG: DivIVA domain-containing protein [Erysipelotrichia bacterium]|nr:DivIVA domain-containing protein [Erysipelotrichia bacterium]